MSKYQNIKNVKMSKMSKKAKKAKKTKNKMQHLQKMQNPKNAKKAKNAKMQKKEKMQSIAKIRENKGNKTKEYQPSCIYQHFVLVFNPSLTSPSKIDIPSPQICRPLSTLQKSLKVKGYLIHQSKMQCLFHQFSPISCI